MSSLITSVVERWRITDESDSQVCDLCLCIIQSVCLSHCTVLCLYASLNYHRKFMIHPWLMTYQFHRRHCLVTYINLWSEIFIRSGVRFLTSVSNLSLWRFQIGGRNIDKQVCLLLYKSY